MLKKTKIICTMGPTTEKEGILDDLIANGMKVVVEITKWPDGRRSAEGRIIEVLGKAGDPGVDILSVMRQYDLSEEFPEDVQQAAEDTELEVSPEEYRGRRDRRDFHIVTIDGDDAKDLDDGVYVEKRGNGYFLGVYIADVSWYVRENQPLDQEARARGTSVYLVDRVIPMAAYCASLIKEGNAVYLDAGSTAKAIAELLVERSNIAVLTHSLSVMVEVAQKLFSTEANNLIAIDMPLDVKPQDTLEKMIARLQERNYQKGVLLLADMGSLCNLGTMLMRKKVNPIWIIFGLFAIGIFGYGTGILSVK